MKDEESYSKKKFPVNFSIITNPRPPTELSLMFMSGPLESVSGDRCKFVLSKTHFYFDCCSINVILVRQQTMLVYGFSVVLLWTCFPFDLQISRRWERVLSLEGVVTKYYKSVHLLSGPLEQFLYPRLRLSDAPWGFKGPLFKRPDVKLFVLTSDIVIKGLSVCGL